MYASYSSSRPPVKSKQNQSAIECYEEVIQERVHANHLILVAGELDNRDGHLCDFLSSNELSGCSNRFISTGLPAFISIAS